MSTIQESTKKRAYLFPVIECIKLDSEISLTLDSNTPPVYGDEIVSLIPTFLNNDPFRNNVG